MEWRNIYRGFLMGTSDVVPGVSGGTIAVVLGIYDRLIAAIDGVFSKEWKTHVRFLIPLGIGMLLAIFSMANLITWLLEAYEQPTMYFFLGLIIGIIPFLLHEADYKKTFKPIHYVFMIISACLVASLAFLQEGNPQAWGESITIGQYVILFFSGWMASMAMLLPGISGSFLLLLIGVYPIITTAIKELDMARVVTVGLGVMIGLLLSSKGINYLFKHYPIYTFATVIGMVLGSVIVIFPGVPVDILLCVIALLGGLIVSNLLGKIEHN
ncbi:DUF368 domain-containing protein [Pontibacillus litoralis]|uniref:Membrane protein n=1 Tax=Pontibacillus litoralis JSM 072002 TaxID=1385512 RepID=A0A0A5HSI8_9BACI|nr:DUF368 domain-containing protein [Pontibacillus litoralis]KGX86587.1 membrane protein [Pontibacillus litoralis JSM 072002]